MILKLGVQVFNDYVPDVWCEPYLTDIVDYFDASCRYLQQKLGVEIEYTVNEFTFHSIMCPKYSIDDLREKPPGWTSSNLKLVLSRTIQDVLKTLEGKADAQLFISQYPFAYVRRQDDGMSERYEIPVFGDRSFMDPNKWLYLVFTPPMTSQLVLWSYVRRFSHELSHLIPYLYPDVMPLTPSFKDPSVLEKFDSGRADFPPYTSNVDQVWNGEFYERGFMDVELFEGTYPVQAL